MNQVPPETQERFQQLRTPAIIIAIAVVLGTTIYFALKDVGKPPLCYQDSCINLDAKNQRCDADVQTIIDGQFTETKLELRYSAKCDAAWTRAIVPPGSILYVEDDRGKKYGSYITLDDGLPSPHYGNMGPGRKLKACVVLPNKKNLCTKLAN
ncbi:MAG: DUF2690 domain-containing protein [Oscillatoriaceae cyanobacterium Prado104]|jgi:hypothetical protein|nr:DUF2690 domain-containing protein [Oscillatoriaceae cyanobacterium Prado104]